MAFTVRRDIMGTRDLVSHRYVFIKLSERPFKINKIYVSTWIKSKKIEMNSLGYIIFLRSIQQD